MRATASIPIFAWSRSRSSSLAIRRAVRLMMLATLCSSRSSTRTLRSCSSSASRISSSLGAAPCGSWPACSGWLACGSAPGSVGVVSPPILARRSPSSRRPPRGRSPRSSPPRERGASPLGAVRLRKRDLEAEALAGRRGPGEHAPRAPSGPAGSAARGNRSCSRPSRSGSPARGSPRSRGRGAATRHRRSRARRSRAPSARCRRRSAPRARTTRRPGLRVADPQLDRAEGVVRAHAPPELGGLDDRAGSLQQSRRSARTPPSCRSSSGSRSGGRCG